MIFKEKPQEFSYQNLRGKKITIMGLGLLGGGAQDALFFIKHGAQLTITDLRNEQELKPSVDKINKYLSTTASTTQATVEWVLGKHKKENFKNTDAILKNPAIPNNSKYLKIAKKNNIPIYTSAGIFLNIANTDKLICITGTKGKSTTASLIYEILKLKDSGAYIAGLPGLSLLKYANESKKHWGVVELSNWQLEGAAFVKESAHIAIITNIEKDHLNRHKNFKEYKEAKKIIFKHQDKKDYLIIPRELKNEVKNTRSKIITYYTKDLKEVYRKNLYKENIAVALKVAEVLNINKKDAIVAIKKFKGLEGRMEYITTVDGTKIYNDTTATNPFATLKALELFKNEKIALILGGEDKNLDYKKLAKKLKKIHFVALLPGTASDKIYTENNKLKKVKDLNKALKECLESKPEILLFSPAAASFNVFSNEFERGTQFIELVNKLKNA